MNRKSSSSRQLKVFRGTKFFHSSHRLDDFLSDEMFGSAAKYCRTEELTGELAY